MIGCDNNNEPNSPNPATSITGDSYVATESPDLTSPPKNTSNSDLENVDQFYNLPQAKLTEPAGLFASPNRLDRIVQVDIQSGENIYVMGKNATGSHLRVVWHNGVGWVPVSFTDYNGAMDKLGVLPVFGREPPACAIPLVTQFNLNSEWHNESDTNLRIAVVVDLFRSRYGDFPPSYLTLIVNSIEMESSKRQIVEQGQFSLKDVVFTLPGYIQPGDTIGYLLDTTSDEPLSFLATIFSIPPNCVWDTD